MQSAAQSFRALCRSGEHTSHSSGHAKGYAQANLVVLPSVFADDFARFCELNPKACPVLEVIPAGSPHPSKVCNGNVDLRSDLPRYRVFRNGQLCDEPTDVTSIWRDDLVSFLIGCSFTFDSLLAGAGLPPRHLAAGRNVPMYRCPARPAARAGPFAGDLVVSLRPYAPRDADRAAALTAQYPRFHGAPVHRGDPGALGVADLRAPDFGDPPGELREGEEPVFWACGVTPQVALLGAQEVDFAITHAPGHMLVCDLTDTEVIEDC